MSDNIQDLTIEAISLSNLRPYNQNPRTHSKKQIRQIAQSIETFGWTNPILIDDEKQVIAGHGRLEAAKLLKLSDAPVIRLSDLSKEQVRAYMIADNRLAELAGWDDELLSIELQSLTEIDLDFDIEVIGFSNAEIDSFILDTRETDDDADALPEIVDGTSPISARGDLWQLGTHRLPPTQVRSSGSLQGNARRWSSPTHPTMFRSKVTYPGLAVSGMKSSPWRQVKCRMLNSQRFSKQFSVSSRHTVTTAP